MKEVTETYDIFDIRYRLTYFYGSRLLKVEKWCKMPWYKSIFTDNKYEYKTIYFCNSTLLNTMTKFYNSQSDL